MKKSIFSLLFAVTTLLFAACEQSNEDLILPASKVKVFMSGDYSIKQKSLLRSQETDSQAIEQGDTVDVWNVKDINVVISAENEFGKSLDGSWVVYDIETDRNLNESTYVQNTPNNKEDGAITSIKMTFLGLYRAEFRMKNGEIFFFYIRHTGTPGSIGDDWENSYAFRLDKETYQIVNDPGHKGYTLYMRYKDYEADKIKNTHAMILCGGNNNFTTKTGYIVYGAKEYDIQVCKYSPGYVKVSFLTEDVSAVNGNYRVYFYFGDFYCEWMILDYAYTSNWATRGEILFKAI